ncbi:MAG: zf-TFIIB domain-containing protein, partial [Candidatus Saccharibacteria bacterium]
GNDLVPVTSGTLTVDVCQEGCGGMWFDQFELKQVDEGNEPAAELESIKGTSSAQSGDMRYTCPKCLDTVMMRHRFSLTSQVVVDECPKCGGFWLDGGELNQLRSEYALEKDRNQATAEYFNEHLANMLVKKTHK